MNEQAQEELTQEQLEMQEAKEIREKLNEQILMGKEMERLKVNPAFKKLFTDLFLETGNKILWENIKHLSEGQMMGKGSDRNLEVLEELKKQVHARLIVDAFINTVEHDADNAAEELAQIDAEEAEEAAAKEGTDNA